MLLILNQPCNYFYEPLSDKQNQKTKTNKAKTGK